MKPSEVIRGGLDQLFEHGHTQGRMRAPDGSLCVVGAIWEMTNFGVDGNTVAAVIAARWYLSAATGHPAPYGHGDAVPAWNDAPDRTFDEVVDLFHKAEKLAEADEVAS